MAPFPRILICVSLLVLVRANPPPPGLYMTDTNPGPESQSVNLTVSLVDSVQQSHITVTWKVRGDPDVFGYKVIADPTSAESAPAMLHSSTRKFVIEEYKSFTTYSVCVQAYYNVTEVITEQCAEVTTKSLQIIVGILAGCIALVPCIIVLTIILYKDRQRMKYAQVSDKAGEYEHDKVKIVPKKQTVPIDPVQTKVAAGYTNKGFSAGERNGHGAQNGHRNGTNNGHNHNGAQNAHRNGTHTHNGGHNGHQMNGHGVIPGNHHHGQHPHGPARTPARSPAARDERHIYTINGHNGHAAVRDVGQAHDKRHSSSAHTHNAPHTNGAARNGVAQNTPHTNGATHNGAARNGQLPPYSKHLINGDRPEPKTQTNDLPAASVITYL